MPRPLATFLALCLLLIQPAAAETVPACNGKSLLEGVGQEQPEELAAARKEAEAIPNGHHLVWRIDGPERKAASWLFGTIHLTDDRVRELPASVEAALGSIKALAVEVENASDRAELQAVFAANPRLIMLPDGKELWDLLDDESERRLKRRLIGVSTDSTRTSKLQPWLLATSFTVPDCESHRVLRGIRRLDDMLIERARARGIEVHSLEKVREQIEMMAAMPVDGQAAQLKALLDPQFTAEDRQETLIQLYLRREISLIFPLMQRAQTDNPALAKAVRHFGETVIAKRNHVMAERAGPLLKRGGVLIAVGAAHLPGREGLVELLRKAGYKVAPAD